jgi:hypothetical protein
MLFFDPFYSEYFHLGWHFNSAWERKYLPEGVSKVNRPLRQQQTIGKKKMEAEIYTAILIFSSVFSDFPSSLRSFVLVREYFPLSSENIDL